MQRLFHLFVLLTSSTLSFGCIALTSPGQAAEGSFSQTVDVSRPLELDVSTGSGSITIRQGEAGRVEVFGQIRVSGRNRSSQEAADLVRMLESEPPIELSGGILRVGHLEGRLRRNVAVSYRIEVPPDTGIRSRTGSGEMEISGIAASVEAETGSGEIAVIDTGGMVRLRTGSGRIRADGIAGSFTGETGSGSVSLVQTAAGDVSVTTGSGDIELLDVDGSLRIRTGSGNIRAGGRMDGNWALETGSGSIRVQLAQGSSFAVNAHTGSGRITSDHPVTIEGTAERRRLRGRVGNGEPELDLSTGSGDISID